MFPNRRKKVVGGKEIKFTAFRIGRISQVFVINRKGGEIRVVLRDFALLPSFQTEPSKCSEPVPFEEMCYDLPG